MGIPKYFRWITNKYDDLIISQYNKIDNLFLDANCLIHPCCRKVLKHNPEFIKQHLNDYKQNKKDIQHKIDVLSTLEERMFQDIVLYIQTLYHFVKPEHLLYVAIDGVAPRAKMEQQRVRRYRSYKEKQMIDALYEKYNQEKEPYWDTNAITPGTTFMLKLSHYLQNHLQMIGAEVDDFTIILSDTNIPGEGEHKIVEYIREHPKEDICCIYGLDADLIMLSLCLENPIYLLRESVQFGKVDMDTLLYFSIQIFKEKLQEEIIVGIDEPEFEPDERVIIDYVFLCFLLGNDFIPHLVNLDINENSIEYLMSVYTTLLSIRKHYLINGTDIQYSFLQQILNNIYNKEDALLQKLQLKIDNRKVYRKKKNHYPTDLDRELDLLRYYPIMNKDNTFKLGEDNWRSSYYKYYFNIHNIVKDTDYIDTLCNTYLEGLQWNLKYYIEGCCSWKWYYPYRAAPCLRELCQHLNNRIYTKPFEKTTPYTPVQQLMLVIPIFSIHLLPKPYRELFKNECRELVEFYPTDFKLDRLNHIWFHECNPIIPILKDERILNTFSPIKLNGLDVYKNRLSNQPIYIRKPIIKKNIKLTID